MEWLEPGFDGWDMMQFYAGDYFADPSVADLEGMDRLDTWIYLTQLTQAEGLRQAVERHRCSQGRTSGSLYWQLDDVWPTVSWSTVDHAGRWKLAHHAVRHANQPVRVLPDRTQGDRVAFVIANHSPRTTEGVVEWSLIDLAGDTATGTVRPGCRGPHDGLLVGHGRAGGAGPSHPVVAMDPQGPCRHGPRRRTPHV